ncbi:MAG: hypothetical protein AAF432_10405, partial [Planctomycetota bacterium]
MKNLLIGFAVVATATTLSFASPFGAEEEEEHFDAWFRNVDGKVVTGSRFEDLSFRSLNERVFGAEMGEDPLFPFSADEPGFQSFGDDQGFGNNWDPFTVFTFNITRTLQVWNGSGFDDADETMNMSFEGDSVDSGIGQVGGFTFGGSPSGTLHDHFELTLNGAGGDPDNGVYLLGLSVGVDGDASSFSEEFFF